MTEKEKFMNLAAKEALKAVNNTDGGPFGAIIVIGNQIIAAGHNMVMKTGDPTNHAEVSTIRKAIETLKKENKSVDLSNAEIYSSCEPCPMCLATICQAKIKKVYIGCTREDAKDINFDDSFIYDVFSEKTKKKQIDLNEVKDIKEFLKSEYNLNVDLEKSPESAFIIKVDRNSEGKVVNAEIVAKGKDNFQKTNDPTSYASVNAIREASKNTKNFDLSKYEMVTAHKPSPLSYATMHWAKLTKVFCGTDKEPENGVNHERVLSTINGDKEKSLLEIESVGRKDCLKSFETWKKKQEKVNYSMHY